jgi:hypothetical protein
MSKKPPANLYNTATGLNAELARFDGLIAKYKRQIETYEAELQRTEDDNSCRIQMLERAISSYRYILMGIQCNRSAIAAKIGKK